MLIKKVDRYIALEVLGPFLGGVAFFTFLLLMFQMFRLADFFIIHGVSLVLLGKLVGLMVVSFLPIVLPIGFLIAILVAFGRLSADSELVALKANGISSARMAIPVFLLSFVVVIFSLGLNLDWVPWCEKTFKTTIIRVANTKVVNSIKPGTFTSGFFDLLIFTDKLDTKRNIMRGVFIFDEREPKNPMTVIAREGEVIPIKSDGDIASAAVMRLFEGNIHRNQSETSTYQKMDFGEYNLYLKIEEGSESHHQKPKTMSYSTLLENIETTPQEKTEEYRDLWLEYWRRYAVAVSPLIFVFVGIGFGTVRTRAVRAGAALVALIVVLIYWFLQTMSVIWSKQGYIPPFLGQQLPNMVMMILGYISFRRASW